MSRILTLAIATALSCACATMQRGTPEAANSALEALQASNFDGARTEADAVLTQFPGNARARAIAAMTLYKDTIHQLIFDVAGVAVIADETDSINQRYLLWSLEQAEAGLAAVEDHLAVAAADGDFHLDLCMGCWRYDWTRDGDIDGADVRLFQIELDADGDWMEGARREPKFRFDVGDIHWARAMVAFQRAAVNVVLAYDWSELNSIMRDLRGLDLEEIRITIKLDDPARIHRARDLVLAGLVQADAARRSYLAETDDEREWLPNPSQKNHPMPLPVDQALYDTWAGVLADMGKLMRGETGISVAEVAELLEVPWEDPPRGFLNIGKQFDEPGDIVLDFGRMAMAADGDAPREIVERMLTDVYGAAYVPEMPASELIARLARMKNEILLNEDTVVRKLRYLLWLN